MRSFTLSKSMTVRRSLQRASIMIIVLAAISCASKPPSLEISEQWTPDIVTEDERIAWEETQAAWNMLTPLITDWSDNFKLSEKQAMYRELLRGRMFKGNK